MKKVLILSGSTGQGHNSCAAAIKEYFELQGVACEITDAFSFVSKQFSYVLSNGHTCLYRYAPALFRSGYSFSDNHPGLLKEKSAVYKVLTSGRDNLYNYIFNGGYDFVISVHLFAAIMVTDLIKNCDFNVKTAFVATDYTCYPSVETCICDKFFVAADELLETYNKNGIEMERLIAGGIPVRNAFFNTIDKAEAKKLLGIKVQSKHLLVMCGSMGCGPLAKILSHIIEESESDIEISVICGTNKHLFKQLEAKYQDNDNLHIVGFTDKISLYMDSADLYLTKPGGISVTEAAVKRLPMVFIDAVAGCEQYNMKFFLSIGAAVTEANSKDLAEKTLAIISDNEQLDKMKNALDVYAQKNGAERIFNEFY